MKNIPGECILNPSLGFEGELKDVAAENPKKVMVIGAGPGGLSAAISAAQRGHHVTVYEKSRWAGGQFRLGSVPAGKGEITSFIRWQMHELEKLQVPVRLETEVTHETVELEKPDIIIAATGARPVIPRIPGADRDFVVTAHEVLSGTKNTGSHIVVVGGGSVGAETANHLASNGKNVTLVEMLPTIAADEVVVPRQGLLAELEKNRVSIYTETAVQEIKDGTVILSGNHAGEIPVDTVVIAVGSKPVTQLAEELEEQGYDVRMIGDAVKVGLAGAAIKQGFWLGRELHDIL